MTNVPDSRAGRPAVSHLCSIQPAYRRPAFVRPIVPGDSAHLAYAIRTADPDTLYSRFLGAPPNITPALLAYLCTVDYQKRFDRAIRTFSALYLAENQPLTALLDLAGSSRRETIRQGFAEAAVALNRDDVAAAVRPLADPGRDG